MLLFKIFSVLKNSDRGGLSVANEYKKCLKKVVYIILEKEKSTGSVNCSKERIQDKSSKVDHFINNIWRQR